MALFGSRKTLQRVLSNGWKDGDERDALLSELRNEGLRATAAVPLVLHADSAVRAAGMEIFLQGADVAGIKALLEAALSESPAIRGYVSRIFPRLPEELADRTLTEMCGSSSTQRARFGWEIALSLRGPLGITWLGRAVSEAPAAIKGRALQRLVQERDPSEVLEVLLVAARETDPLLSSVALEAVSKVEDPRVIELMVERFAHGDATARVRAADYLRLRGKAQPDEMRARMLDLLGQGEDATRRLSVEILLETGEPHEVLLAILRFAKDLVGWLRTRILETLQTFGEQVLKPAVRLLQHTDEEVRTMALVLAEQFHDPRLVPHVAALLKAEDWWLRINAADVLGRIGDESAVAALVEALQDEDTRWGAIDALAQIGSVHALKPLSLLLRDKRQEVRLEVVQAFSRFTDGRLVPLLQQVAQKDPSSEVRTRANEVSRAMAGRLELSFHGTEGDTVAISSSQLDNPLDKLLALIREQGASDLHISVGEPPIVRRNGKVTRLEKWKPLNAQQTDAAIRTILSPRHREALERAGEVDFCHAIPEVGRYRANAYVQRKGLCAAFRVIPNVPPTFTDIRLPGRLTELLDYHQGIIIVSGPAGSGKSTTLSAIVNLINESRSTHVITLEDPIEFVHPVKTALINQREVGLHTESFARALRGALREDPDVIVVGELRDPETIRMALEAAETGHLVVATLHTTSAVATVDRLIGSFPPDEQGQIRMSLSESLKYVVSQSLMPRKDGTGRVALFEILKGTFSIGTLIRDDKTFQIQSLMQIGRRQGMQTVNMALLDLVEAGLISPEAAWSRSPSPAEFEPLCDPRFLKQLREEETGEVAT